MSDRFCPIPWIHSSTLNDGDLRACCQCVDPPYSKIEGDNSQTLNARFHTPNDVINSKLLKSMRSDLLSEVANPNCRLCWEEEANDISSKRQMMNRLYPKVRTQAQSLTNIDGSIDIRHFPIRYYDLRFGNNCNLKCRSCGPHDSNLWYEDWALLQNSLYKNTDFVHHGKTYTLTNSSQGKWRPTENIVWTENSPYLRYLHENIENVDRFYFTGGEPLINRHHWELLDRCIDSGHAKNITLEYNSNFMSMPKMAEEKWRHFKFVSLYCSVDATGKAVEYMRPPAHWETIRHNILRFDRLENAEVVLSPTVSVLNILALIDLIKWSLIERSHTQRVLPHTHLLIHPSYLNVQILPQAAKNFVRDQYEDFFDWTYKNFDWFKRLQVKAKYSGIIDYMNSGDQSEHTGEFFRVSHELDRIRGHSLNESLPEIPLLLTKEIQSLKKQMPCVNRFSKFDFLLIKASEQFLKSYYSFDKNFPRMMKLARKIYWPLHYQLNKPLHFLRKLK